MKTSRQPMPHILRMVQEGRVCTPGAWHSIHLEIQEMPLRDRKVLYDGLLPLIGRDAVKALFREWSPLPEDVPAFKRASEMRGVA